MENWSKLFQSQEFSGTCFIFFLFSSLNHFKNFKYIHMHTPMCHIPSFSSSGPPWTSFMLPPESISHRHQHFPAAACGLISYKSVFDQESWKSSLTFLKFQTRACPYPSKSESERATLHSTPAMGSAHLSAWHMPASRCLCEFPNNKGQASLWSHLLIVLSVLVSLGASYLTFLF